MRAEPADDPDCRDGSPSVLAVGAGVEQAPAIEAARELGLRVVAADRNPDAAGMRHAHHAAPIDVADEAAVVALAREEHTEAVVPWPIGRLLTTVVAANDACGLRGPSRAAAQACTDKQEFASVLQHVGLPRPAQRIARGRTQLLAAIGTCGLPCVLKPRAGSAAGASSCSDAT